MPCSDEFFYQVFSNLVYFMFCLNIYLYFEVMFVELNQGKSQKYLDLMNQNLAYISCNNSSTWSPGGSFESFAGSTFQNKRSLTGFYLHAVICLPCSMFVIWCYFLMILTTVRFGSGSGLHLPGSYSPITLPIYGTPGQVSQVCSF